VPGVTARDEDLLAFSPTSLGATTSGTWALYFDGSDVALTNSTEDVDGVSIASDGKIYLSTTGVFSVSGVSGDDEDVFVCTPTSLGDTTACNFSSTLFFDGSANGIGPFDIDAIEVP
jgi:hypothetical protein